MRRTAIALLLGTSLMLVLAQAPSRADPSNKNTLSTTLDCGAERSVDIVYEYSSTDAFHLVSTSSNFLWKSLQYVTPEGQSGEIDRGIQGGGHSSLVTCTYTGPASGNSYTVTGFFTS
ncbi:MAG: hypothetical protein ACJ77A_13655 [Actinomycetota bacterium]